MIVEAKLILKNVTFSKNYGPLPKPKQKTSHLTGIKDIAGECKEKASAIAVNKPKKIALRICFKSIQVLIWKMHKISPWMWH